MSVRRRVPLAPFWPVAVHATQRPLHPAGMSFKCWHCNSSNVGTAPRTGCITSWDLAEWAGVSRRTAIRWMAVGAVPIYDADKMATAIGVHPATIWPEFHDVGEAS